MRAREQLTPEFVAINPQHTVPTLNDNGDVIWDSHAICTYLIGKYGGTGDHPLYPADLVVRAHIDQRLHFNNGILFPRLKATFRPFLYDGAYEVSAQSREESLKAFDLVEAFLSGTSVYMVRDRLSVADLVIYPSVTQLMLKVDIDDGDGQRFAKLVQWLCRMRRKVPYLAELNGVHMMHFSKCLEEIIAKNRAAAKMAEMK